MKRTRMQGDPRGGFAVLTVLMVLMALLVMVAPFLLTVRNANSAAAELSDRADARVALDSASRHARAVLRESHPARDQTPYFDSADELRVEADFDDDFLEPDDAKGTMWDVEAHDLAGYIDLNSVPPHLIANLTGLVTRTAQPVDAEADLLPTASTAAFPETGFLWVAGERMAYGQREARAFPGVTRGLLAGSSGDESALCGPRPPQSIAAGTAVFEQRVWAAAEWRVALANRDGSPDPARLDGFDQLAEVETFAMSQELGAEFVDALAATCSVLGDEVAGPRWQRAVRVENSLEAGDTCQLKVDDSRWFNPGTTVQLTDGRQTELALVLDVGGNEVTLTEPVLGDYAAYEAELRPLARRPVNLNTAPPDVLRALFENLKLRRINSRITTSEALQLVEVVVESRPFEGFQDFVERLVLPAGGLEALPDDAPVVPVAFEGDTTGIIDEDDAVALYLNALNANDRALEFSTMPFAFTSRDVYGLELRSAVNAKSGVARVGLARDDVELVVPQELLMHLWTRQEDFDLALRLEREAPWWTTGPEATSQAEDGDTTPPSRSNAHLGEPDPRTGERLRVYASRDDDDGWAKLAPARVEETTDTIGHIEHYDRESTDPEGRDTTEAPPTWRASEPLVGWRGTGETDFLRPLRLSFWLEPLANLVDGQLLFDLGAPGSASSVRDELQSDRVSLVIDDGDLVLRVRDGSRDHPGTEFEEVAEVRYPLSEAGSPGLPVDTWTHVDIDVRGNRPSQMALVVDGRMSSETPGLTRLTSTLSDTDTRILVESTEGFPQSCVIRIGEEIIEAEVTGETTFEAIPGATRPGRGGRMARELMVFGSGASQASEDPIPAAVFMGKETQHASGTSVELYGYSMPIAATVNDYSEPLRSSLGPFRVARVVGGDHGPNQTPAINVELDAAFFDFSPTLGNGFVSELATSLQLGSADRRLNNMSEAARKQWIADELMPAFSPEGGYAAIVQGETDILQSSSDVHLEPSNNTRYQLGGISVVRYTGIDREEGLLFLEPGSATSVPIGGVAYPAGDAFSAGDKPIGPAAFVTQWFGASDSNSGVTLASQLARQTFCFPISLPAQSSGALGLLDPALRPNEIWHSELAQIAPANGESPESTEWVRYDQIVQGHIVRTDPRYLRAAQLAAISRLPDVSDGNLQPLDPGPPGGPGGTGNPGDPSGPGGGGGGVPGTGNPGGPGGGGPPPPPQANAAWSQELGEPDFTDSDGIDLPVSRAVASALQFRGVFGTHSGDHAAGELLQPVFRLSLGRSDLQRTVADANSGPAVGQNDLQATLEINGPLENLGLPGAGDHAFLMGTPTDGLNFAGTEVVLQHVHRPFQHLRHGWDPDPNDLFTPLPNELEAYDQLIEMQDFIWFSLESPVPFTPLFESDAVNETDPRRRPRLTMFPSGELPRGADGLALGGRFDNPQVEGAALLVDEVVFGDTDFGAGLSAGAAAGASLILAVSVDEAATILEVVPDELRRETVHAAASVLDGLPPSGGLLRIGQEVVAYDGVQSANGTILLAENGGRGLLGTTPQPHSAGETISWLEGQVAATLAGELSADASTIAVTSTVNFPSRGTVRIGDELIHYTRLRGGALEMPQASDEPGQKDAKGAGLFRGRYGSGAQGHAARTPVVVHPFRYWDRWADRADVPELGYFGFGVSQPGAFWTSLFWQEEAPGHAGARLGVLQRTDPDVAWDADPSGTEGLDVYLEGHLDRGGNPIGAQSGRVDWRAFVTYDPGSFDPASGLAHGWKTTPVLRLFGAECFAPGQTLRSVER